MNDIWMLLFKISLAVFMVGSLLEMGLRLNLSGCPSGTPKYALRGVYAGVELRHLPGLGLRDHPRHSAGAHLRHRPGLTGNGTLRSLCPDFGGLRQKGTLDSRLRSCSWSRPVR